MWISIVMNTFVVQLIFALSSSVIVDIFYIFIMRLSEILDSDRSIVDFRGQIFIITGNAVYLFFFGIIYSFSIDNNE